MGRKDVWNPKIEVVVGLIKLLYSLPGCEMGGLCHFVLEDGCLTDADIKYCMDCCERTDQIDSELGMFICLMLSTLTMPQRKIMLEMMSKDLDINELSWETYTNKGRN